VSTRAEASKPVILVLTTLDAVKDVLVPHFEAEGWAWRISGGPAADEQLRSLEYSLAVVDVSVDHDPFALCRRLKTCSSAPVVVFSGDHRAYDFVPLLEAGADDYLLRPERTRELVARMRALLRRAPIGPRRDDGASLVAGDLSLDPERHRVLLRGVELALTLRQFQLLEFFMAHPNQVLPRDTILDRVWGADGPRSSNTLEVQILRLRRWIEEDPSSPKTIVTVRGLGYRFVAN
jgi:two-component system response regulator RegX3